AYCQLTSFAPLVQGLKTEAVRQHARVPPDRFKVAALLCVSNATLSSLMAAPKKMLVIVAFAALYLIWGSTYLGIRFSIETIPPFLMAGARFVLAGTIMYAVACSQGIGESNWRNWRTSLIIGACLLLGGNGGVTISEKYIDSGLAALVVAIVPIYIVLLGWLTGMAPRPTPRSEEHTSELQSLRHLVCRLLLE